MHELSIARSIREIVRQHTEGREGMVRTVRLKVGAMAGVVPESLQLCFTVVNSDTPMQNASLQIATVPFRIHCKKCSGSFGNELGVVVCPECGSSDTTIASGTELEVVEIELCDIQEEVE